MPRSAPDSSIIFSEPGTLAGAGYFTLMNNVLEAPALYRRLVVLFLALPWAPSATFETKGEMIPGTFPEFVRSFLAIACLRGARTSFPEISTTVIIIDGDGVPRHLD